MPSSQSAHVRKNLRLVTRYVRGELDVNIDRIDDASLLGVRQFLISSGNKITLRASDVARVLNNFVAEKLARDDLARWGSFVYHGYPTWRKSPRKHPLPIGYETKDEELIAEVMSEIEQIGDLIDGDFTRERALHNLRRLLPNTRDDAL